MSNSIESNLRVCKKCGEEKGLEEFPISKSCREGREWRCKECVKKYNKAYRKNNSEINKANCKAYYKNNSEKLKAYHKKYYDNNPEKIKAISKKYYYKNLEKIRAYQRAYNRAYQRENADRIKAYRKNNPEKIKAIYKKYYEKNLEKIRERVRIFNNKYTPDLHRVYVINKIVQRSNLKAKDIPEWLIEEYRDHLKLFRAYRSLQRLIKQHS